MGTTLHPTAPGSSSPGGPSRSSAWTLYTRETPRLTERCTVLRIMTMDPEHSELVWMLALPGLPLEQRSLLPSRVLLTVVLTSPTPRRDSQDTTTRASLSALMSIGLTSSASTLLTI